MKKILFYSFLVISTFSFVFQTTSAISYNGSFGSQSYPQSPFGIFELDSYPSSTPSLDCWMNAGVSYFKNYYSSSIHSCYSTGATSYVEKNYFTTFDIDTFLTGAYYRVNSNNFGGSVAYGHKPFGVELIAQRQNDGRTNFFFWIADSEGSQIINTGSVYSIPFDSVDSSFYPRRFSTSLIVTFAKKEVPRTLLDSHFDYYIPQIKFCFYNTPGGSNSCAVKSYINADYPDGLFYGRNIPFFNNFEHYQSELPFPNTDGWLYRNSYVPAFEQETDPLNSIKLWEFYSSASGTLQNSLTRWFGGTSSTLTEGGITNGGTGGTNYFASCTSYLDVGCYVQGLSSQIGASLASFTSGLFPSWISTSSGGLFDFSTNSGVTLFTGSFVSFESAYFYTFNGDTCEIGSIDVYQYDLLEHEPGTPIDSGFLKFTLSEYSNNLVLKAVLSGVDFLMNKSIGFIGRVTGLFFGTALPPMNHGDVCFMGKVITIEYQRFIPTHDPLTPTQFNRVNSHTPGDPTTFDWIVRAIASMMLLFFLFASFRNISSNHT